MAQARQRIEHAEAVYRGTANSTYDGQPYAPLDRELPGLSEAAFKHALCLVFSRALSPLVAPSEGVDVRAPYFLPLVDLVNHADQPNVESSGARARARGLRPEPPQPRRRPGAAPAGGARPAAGAPAAWACARWRAQRPRVAAAAVSPSLPGLPACPPLRPAVYKGFYEVTATKAIQRGQEITFDYGTKDVDRPDGALLFYGQCGEGGRRGRRRGACGIRSSSAAAVTARAVQSLRQGCCGCGCCCCCCGGGRCCCQGCAAEWRPLHAPRTVLAGFVDTAKPRPLLALADMPPGWRKGVDAADPFQGGWARLGTRGRRLPAPTLPGRHP